MVKTTYNSQYKTLKEYNLEFAMGSSHFIMFDQPDWFIENVLKALED